LKEGKFKDAEPMLDRLLAVATGTNRERLEALRSDLPRLQKDHEDAVLRKLSDDWTSVHASCEASLVKRQTAAGFARVTKFVKDLGLEEGTRSRVPGVNYEMLFNASTD